MFYAVNQVFLFFAVFLLTNKKGWSIIIKVLRKDLCGCSSMVEFQPSKLAAWVRFPSPAPCRICALSSVDRVPGYEPVGRRFESFRARQKHRIPNRGCGVFVFLQGASLSRITKSRPCHPAHRATRFACRPAASRSAAKLLFRAHHPLTNTCFFFTYVVVYV